MSRHHPSCGDDAAHVHPSPGPLVLADYLVWLDGRPIFAAAERHVAQRLAELINAHGLADVPDHIPDAVLWAAPDPTDRIIDWRLPVNPKETTP